MQNIFSWLCCGGSLLFLLFIVFFFSELLKKDREEEKLFSEMKRIYSRARMGQISESQADTFFRLADKAMASMQIPFKDEKPCRMEQEIEQMCKQITLILAMQNDLENRDMHDKKA